MNINIKKVDNKNKLNILTFILLTTLILTVIVQFFIGTPYYPFARIILYGIFLIATGLYLPYFKLKKNNFLIAFFILTFVALINALLILLLTGKNEIGTVLQPIFAFIILFLGYNLNASVNHVHRTLEIYAIITTILGFYIIFFFGEGFSITQNYFYSSKNQVGSFIAMGCIIYLYYLVNNHTNIIWFSKKRYLLILFLMNLFLLLTIRNRSGIVALLITALFYWLSKAKITVKKKTFIFIPIFSLIVMLILYSGLFNPVIGYIYDSLFLNYEIEDINSLSAGRTDGYIQAIDFIKSSPFFGELSASSGITMLPHNYLLSILKKFGIMGMLPLIGLYGYIWIYVIKRIVINKEIVISLYLLLLILVISLFEPTYPYSPMTTVSLAWFLLGYYLKSTGKKNS